MENTNIEKLAKYISTAKAAYGIFGAGDFRQLLIAADFTDQEADEFVDNYTVAAPQFSARSGLQAVLFQDKSGGNVLALRGSEQIYEDFSDADFSDIGPSGFASSQAVDLYRYWKMLTTPSGIDVSYSLSEIATLWSMYELGDYGVAIDSALFAIDLLSDTGLGVLAPGAVVDVTGHSLGGNLAYVFASMFPQNTGQVVTINAPGINRPIANGQENLIDLGFSQVDSSKITSVNAEGDLVHLVSGSQPGSIVNISQEVGHGPSDGLSSNHSVINGLDSLNLMNLFSKLDPSQAENPSGILADFMRASSNQSVDTFENMLDGLRKTLLGDDVAKTTPGAKGHISARNEMYNNMDELSQAITNGNLKYLVGNVSLVKATQNGREAKTDYGHFLALYFLTPFALSGNEALLRNLNNDLYVLWKEDSSLSDRDRDAGKANFSDMWYADRSAMLAAQISRNTDDALEDTKTNFGSDDIIYFDKVVDASPIDSKSQSSNSQGIKIISFGDEEANTLEGGFYDDRLYGGAEADDLRGNEGNDYLEGGKGADKLKGGKDSDNLYGGADSDELTGGEGNDLLRGGAGNDKYIFSGNFGRDIIIDDEGSDVLNGIPTTFAFGDGSGVIFRDSKTNPTFEAIKIDEGGGNTSLLITSLAGGAASGSILIKNWNDGFGITLTNNKTPPPTNVLTVNGGSGNNAISLDNLLGTANITNASLISDGGDGKDLIQGTEFGSDSLSGGKGDDYISGGFKNNITPGIDTLSGGEGNDFIFVPQGGSIAHGNEGDDYLSSYTAFNAVFNGVQELIVSPPSSLHPHARVTRDQMWEDQLKYFSYDTKNFKSPYTNSFTSEFAKYDSTIAGHFIAKNVDYSYSGIVDNVSFSHSSGFIIDYNYYEDGDGLRAASGILGRDLRASGLAVTTFKPLVPGDYEPYANLKGANLFGDAGNDSIIGGMYSDYLSGGADNDTLRAGYGNDVLDGGDGDDRISGEYGIDILMGGAGKDILWGGEGNDFLDGGAGEDEINGDEGDDYLFGGSDEVRDELYGGNGKDTIVMGKSDGADGGAGDDIFIWEVYKDQFVEGAGGGAANANSSSSNSSLSDVPINIHATPQRDDRAFLVDYQGNNTLVLVGIDNFSQVALDVSDTGTVLLNVGANQLSIERGASNGSYQIMIADSVEQAAESQIRFSTVADFSGNNLDTSTRTSIANLIVNNLQRSVTLTAEAANTLIAGGILGDVLTTNLGGSTLLGGRGDDKLFGDVGDDTYWIRMNDGKDSITEKGGNNHIKLDGNITAEQLIVRRVGGDLLITISDEQTISVKGMFNAQTGALVSANSIQDIQFSDGTQWDIAKIKQQALINTAGNDVIGGFESADIINGGLGSDQLSGGAGDDIYQYSLGDGNDVISDNSGSDTLIFAAGILQSQVTAFRDSQNNLVLKLNTGEKIIVSNAFDSAGNFTSQAVESIKFSDGAVWNSGKIQQNVQSYIGNIINGTTGNDTLSGDSGKNIFIGNKGNDILTGNIGDDIYRYAFGDGNDVITDLAGNDRIELGVGITQGQTLARSNGADLELSFIDGGKITVKDMFVSKSQTPVDPHIASIIYELQTNWLAQAESLIEVNYGLVASGDITLGFESGVGFEAAHVETIMGDNNKVASQKLILDLSDFSSSGNGSGPMYYDRIIAHEMVHAVMARNMDMANMPGWFLEGAAEFIHGADERVKSDLEDIGSQAKFNLFFKTTEGSPSQSAGYSVSYIAVKLLDSEIRENGGSGIRELFDLLKTGKTLDQSFSALSLAHGGMGGAWNNLASFETHVKAVGFASINTLLNLNNIDTGSIAGSDYGHSALDANAVVANKNVGAATHFNLIVPQEYINTVGVNNELETIKFADGASWNLARIKQEILKIPNLTLTGTSGNDTLVGGAGNDTLAGLKADDKLEGGAGNDTYQYSLGDGSDTIVDSSGSDHLILGSGILQSQVRALRDSENNLIIMLSEGKTIKIQSAFDADGNFTSQAVEFIKISGFTWDQARIKQEVLKIPNLTITGTSGNDTLFGGSGNDTLNGGQGEDFLEGGFGDDVYKYALGEISSDKIYDESGNDRIEFGADISEDRIVIRHNENRVSIRVFDGIETSGHINIVDYPHNAVLGVNGFPIYPGQQSPLGTIESIKFSNGSIWDAQRIKQEMLRGTNGDDRNDGGINGFDTDDVIDGGLGDDEIYGDAGDDLLTGGKGDDWLGGGEGNDLLTGGKGNDRLSGYVGNDIYNYSLGDGDDEFTDSYGLDRIEFGAGILESNVKVGQISNGDIIFTLSDGATVTISEVYDYDVVDFDANKLIESVKFSDGKTWDFQRIKQELLITTNSADRILGFSSSDMVDGREGDDDIRGGAGNDTLLGGIGRDMLDGGLDSDILNGGAGNDRLKSGDGKDTLIGGEGIDFLNGGLGDDIYQINLGDGYDIISDDGGVDTIRFGQGINPDNVMVATQNNRIYFFTRAGQFVEVDLMPSGPQANTHIESVSFANGEIWDSTKIQQRINITKSLPAVIINDGTRSSLLDLSTLTEDSYINNLNSFFVRVGNTNNTITAARSDDKYFDTGTLGNNTFLITPGYTRIKTFNISQDKLVFADGTLPDDLRLSFDKRSNGSYVGDFEFVMTLSSAEQETKVDLHGMFGSLYFDNSDFFDRKIIDFLNGISWSINDLTTYFNKNTVENGPLGFQLNEVYRHTTNDIYTVEKNDGITVIDDSGGTDILRFGIGIHPSDVIVKYDDRQGIIFSYGNKDAVVIKDMFGLNGERSTASIETIEFASGEKWDFSEIKQHIIYLGTDNNENFYGLETNDLINALGGDDVLWSGGGDDTLLAGDGNDRLRGGAGSDTLNGGRGNDVIEGGGGHNTYLYNVGDGSDWITVADDWAVDTLILGEGIDPNKVVVSVNVYGYRLYIPDVMDIVIVDEGSAGSYRKSYTFSDFRVEFFDGIIWSEGYLNKRTQTGADGDDYIVGGDGFHLADVYGNGGNDQLIVNSKRFGYLDGGSGNDTLSGASLNDRLTGGTGNDYNNGGSGDDNYIFARGDGQDVILDVAGNDRITLGGGITVNDIFVARDNENLIIGLNSGEKITVLNMLDSISGNLKADNAIERICFEDGKYVTSTWIMRELNGLPRDLIVPQKPTAAFDGISTITGFAELGSFVRITDANGENEQTLQASITDGWFGFSFMQNYVNGEIFLITAADEVGNVSGVLSINAPDLTAPDNPTAEFDTTGKIISGVAEKGSTVVVKNSNGTTTLGTVIAHAVTGTYSITLTSALINNQLVSVTAKDAAGNISWENWINAPDKTAPLLPTAKFNNTAKIISGIAEAGSTVVVKSSANLQIGTVVADETTGAYSITFATALINKDVVTVTAQDAAGNISSALSIAAPDLNAPPAPTAKFDSTGKTITGVASAGSIVVVKNGTNSTTLVTVTANPTTGAYTATLTTALINKESVNVTAKNSAGNVSPITSINAPDKTAPTFQSTKFDSTAKIITGITEAGSTVTVKNASGLQIGIATADVTSGAFTVTLASALVNREVVSVTAKDTAGNSSSALPLTAPDVKPPAQPTAAIDATGKIITGSAEASSTVMVKNAVGTQLASAVASSTGTYSITLATAVLTGEVLNLTAKDAAGNISVAKLITTADKTAPTKPTAAFDAAGKVISGIAEAGSTVVVKNAASVQLGTVVANATTGAYSITIATALINKEVVTVTAKDAAGNTSSALSINAPDKVAPTTPTAAFDSTAKIITGVAEAGSTISVKNAALIEIGTAVANATTGAYTVTLVSALLNRDVVSVTVKDAAGNISPPKSITAPDAVAPTQPTAAIDSTGKIITGVAEVSSTVIVKNAAGTQLGSVTANATTGAYTITLTTALLNNELLSITAKDAAGNTSIVKTINAPDKTAPALPTATFNITATIISGVVEANATVSVKNAESVEIGTAVANTAGAYSITLTVALINKETVNITAKDAAGNISAVKTVTAPDVIAPTQPTAAIDITGKIITGVAEKSSTVIVKNATSTQLGSVTANATTGAYTITLATALLNNELLSITAKDAAGNTSVAKAINAPDKTAPAIPTATFNKAATIITGVAEAGATVRAKDAAAVTIASAVADASGAYTITLTAALTNREVINVTAKDSAGNVSGSKSITAPDVIAPTQPTAAIDTTGKIITGVAEKGSTVIVKNAASTQLSSIVANTTTGAYSMTLATAFLNNEILNITAKDTAGNISIVKTINAPDKTAPIKPTAVFDTSGKVISGVAEIGSTVIVKNAASTQIGTAKADANGVYSITLATALVKKEIVTVTAKDAAGNTSASTSATAPSVIVAIAAPQQLKMSVASTAQIDSLIQAMAAFSPPSAAEIKLVLGQSDMTQPILASQG